LILILHLILNLSIPSGQTKPFTSAFTQSPRTHTMQETNDSEKNLGVMMPTLVP